MNEIIGEEQDGYSRKTLSVDKRLEVYISVNFVITADQHVKYL
jgi:hypothetical protein